MNRYQFELALKKQRLQFCSAEQRRQLTQEAVVLLPVFSTAERLRSGVRWVREHPALVAAVLVTVMVARPRTVLRWSRRGWLTWLAWRRWSGTNNSKTAQRSPIIERVSAMFSR